LLTGLRTYSLQPHKPAPIDPAQLPPRHPAADGGTHHGGESLAIVALATVEPKHLLIDVTLQVEGRDRNVSAFDCSLKQRPEVFEPVGVDDTPNVLRGMVYGLMSEPLPKGLIYLAHAPKWQIKEKREKCDKITNKHLTH
jgi:hypothetical protein